jgi:hypothetical protein
MRRLVASLFLSIASACSAAAPSAQGEEAPSKEQVADVGDACDVEQWRALASGLLTSFPRWCVDEPEARERALEWAHARGLRFETEHGDPITLETYRRYVREGGDHATIHALDWRQLEELTCGDITRMLELGEPCGVRGRIDGEAARCRSSRRMLDPAGTGEATRMGCAPYTREQCAAMPECAQAGRCSPHMTEGGYATCRAASDEDCAQIEACRVEGLECRYDAESDRCEIPGCMAEASGSFEEQQEALWSARAAAWALPAASKESAQERVSRLLAACQGRSHEDGFFTARRRLVPYDGGFIGEFSVNSPDGVRYADVVRVSTGSGALGVEHMATVDATRGVDLSACEANPTGCLFDAASQTFLSGARVCDDDHEETACATWAERERAWADDLRRDDLAQVLEAHLGRCEGALRVGAARLGADVPMQLVTVSGDSNEESLLLATYVEGQWRLDLLEENYHDVEGISSSADVKLLDPTPRRVLHAGPFARSFRYVATTSADYGADGPEGQTACCDSGATAREVEVFLLETRDGEEVTALTPGLKVQRRFEAAYTTFEEDGVDVTGSETSIEPIDAKRWRLRTIDHTGKKSSRVIGVDPKSLGSSLSVCEERR